MVKLNDVEKNLQNYQKGSEYNVRYENNGAKRIYIIYPGKALEFIRQVAANTPPPPFLSRPNIKSNSTVEYKIEESNGVIVGQSFTVKTPDSGSDFSRENQNIGNSDLWSSSIFGIGSRQFNNQTNNQRTLELGQPDDQDFSVTQSQFQARSIQGMGICQCKSAIKKTLPGDWNRCLNCGGMFDDAGSEAAKRRQKDEVERIKQEQEENFRIGQENERRNEERFNRFKSDSSSTSYQHYSYPETQTCFEEINEDNDRVETEGTWSTRFFQQEQKPIIERKVIPNSHETKMPKVNQDKLPKTVLIIGSSIVLVSGVVGLLIYLRRYTKGNQRANN